MLQFLSRLRQTSSKKVASWVLIAFACLASLVVFNQPSYAATFAPEHLTNEDKVERAYDGFSEATGIAEETYQQRVSEGQDPKKMPQPYQRITNLEGKEVPATSLVESTVSKAKGLVEKVTGK